jgi:hypothetical protein
MNGTRVQKTIGFGLLMLVLGFAALTGIGVHQPDGRSGVPAARAEGGAPPDLTRPNGEGQPTPTPTPTPLALP